MSGHSFRELRRWTPRGDPFAQRVTVTGEENPRGAYVLYWAQSARRLRNNLALEYAIELANARNVPVVVYESLRPDYPHANDRIHAFVLEGVRQNAADAAARGLHYHFFLPRTAHEARGVVRKLAAAARCVVTDDYPTSIIAAQTARFVAASPVAVHRVDGNGILPMRLFGKELYSARFLRDRAHASFRERWPALEEREPRKRFRGALDLPRYDGAHPRDAARGCPIDHRVAPVPAIGGRDAALARLGAFVEDGLRGYANERNKSLRHLSGLSPYLHFGHIGIHEIAAYVLRSSAPDEDVDAFLEESIIRRELSFNLCFYNSRYDSIEALPSWARATLDAHRRDRRKPSYTYEELEAAQTYDAVWNLAQRQLLARGTIHGYLRMLWGKKILEWSESPEAALAAMIRLHDVYAIDGRDPNTYAGVLWCLGKHDRPWVPERPIFGTIRWMSSEQSAKKVRLAELEALVDGGAQQSLLGSKR
ncbi:MAG TPA: deoxyribodipyrimidine photolyase [Thermoanaerobaculia bacterium]|nr:deoxyribodipyrimidine photolyase [Thermoanaerobaculia bacterium]